MNLTVSQRIWGGFVFITFLLLLIGGNSLGKISNINKSAQLVNQLSLPALSISSELQVEFVMMGKISLQIYHAKEEAELDRLRAEFKKIEGKFDALYKNLIQSVSVHQALSNESAQIKKTYTIFAEDVNTLYLKKKAVIQLQKTLKTQLEEIEINSDDASTVVLDIIDETNLESEAPRAFQAASNMENSFLSIVSNSTDLISVNNAQTLETLNNEQKFSITDLERGLSLINEAIASKEPDLLSDLTDYFEVLKTNIIGSNALVINKQAHLDALSQAKTALDHAENETKTAIEQLDKLVQISSTLAFDLQAEVNDNVSSANLWTLIGMAIATLIAILVAYLTVQRIIRPLAEVNNILETVASGDMTRKLDDSAQDEFGELATNCNTLIDNLRTLIQGIISRSTQLAAASEETSTITTESSQAMQAQRAQVEQAATATTEMSSTSQSVTHSAEEALNEIKHADNEAERVKGISAENKNTIEKLASEVDSASKVINKLHQDSASIGSILDVIRGIAEQTNLLALNAAIEAARAGEQGRGFAVVADEVRSLASKTQESTQEIQAMIESLQSGAEEAVSVMAKGKEQAVSCVNQSEQATQALELITKAVSQAHDMSEQISTAAQEQHHVSLEISERLESIVSITEQASSGAEQTSTASQEVAKLAEELRLSVDEFKV
jgi:methyl-accepting chemotaxis protein